MNIFGTGRRGCFVAFNLETKFSRGAVLSLPTSTEETIQLPQENDFSFPLLVTNISIGQKERAFFLRCFNNRIYTYAFGTDIGQVGVDFIGFLADGVVFGDEEDEDAVGGEESEVIEIVLDAYSKARVSSSKKFATLSFGTNGSLSGFVTDMRSQTSNA